MLRVFRSFRPAFVLAALLAAFVVAGAPVASAHDVLVSSSPEDGAQLDAPPEDLTLTFNNELVDLGEEAAAVVVTDGSGTEVASGPLAIDGRDATFDLPDLAGGEFTAAWSVVSSDGHRIQGELAFTVTEASAAPETSAPAASASPATTPEASATPTPSATPSDDAKGLTLPGYALPIFGVGILAALIATIIRLRRTQR